MRKKNLHAPNSSANGAVYLPDIQSYEKHFILRHSEIHSWREVARPYGDGLKPNMARMIANGYDPGNKIRQEVLRLPPKEKVETCKECGKVHIKKHPRKSKRKPRVAIRLDNPASAARSIKGHMERGKIEELVRLLDET